MFVTLKEYEEMEDVYDFTSGIYRNIALIIKSYFFPPFVLIARLTIKYPYHFVMSKIS